MVIKGRSRSNGAQLADYLQASKENERVQVIDIRGTTRPDDLRRSLVEMSLSSELTKRGKNGLYHAQINPAIGEDRPMTPEDWQKAADILEAHLGYTGQKRAIVLHEKAGRIHGHVVWERYDHETSRLRTDSQNYKKHDLARAQIEQEFGHERTPQRAERAPDIKTQLSQLWREHSDPAAFIQAAEDAGFKVCQGNDRRPFRVVTPDGHCLDLTRQLEGVKTKEVRDRLQPVRGQLATEAEALQKYRDSRTPPVQQPEPEQKQSDNSRELSDSQTLSMAMKLQYKQQDKEPERPKSGYSYSFKIQQTTATPEPEQRQPPTLPRQQQLETQSEKKPELSDSQDKAAALLERYRQRQADQQQRQRKEQEARQQAREQTRKTDQSQSVTDAAAEMLERYKKRQQERNRGGDELEY